MDAFPDSTVRAGDVADFGIVAAAVVNDGREDLDGVWWEDRLDESMLSAPRGVLSLSKIDEWVRSARQVDEG